MECDTLYNISACFAFWCMVSFGKNAILCSVRERYIIIWTLKPTWSDWNSCLITAFFVVVPRFIALCVEPAHTAYFLFFLIFFLNRSFRLLCNTWTWFHYIQFDANIEINNFFFRLHLLHSRAFFSFLSFFRFSFILSNLTIPESKSID